MNHIFQIELYPIPLPETCEVLAELSVQDMLVNIGKEVSVETTQDDFSPETFFTKENILSNTHHVEVIVQPDFQWAMAWSLLKEKYPHLAWSKVGRESIGSHDIYSYEFVALTVFEGKPTMGLGKFLQQRYVKEPNPEQAFMKDITQLANHPHCWGSEAPQKATKEKNDKSDKKKAKRKPAFVSPSPAKARLGETDGKVTQLLEELKTEHNAKERMHLANQKMEIIVAQVENYNMQRAMEDLAYEGYFEEDWAKRLKISLREYSILMQKARFLEQLWSINRDLETRVERMTVSDNELTYEREQVKRLKERLSPHEIYLVMDECQEIEKRCKVRTRIPWRKPYVKMMQMDYDSLKRKAQYFDLLQGENVLLDQVVHKEKGYD